MSDMKVDQILTQIRALREQTGVAKSGMVEADSFAVNAPSNVNFGAMLKESINAVNSTQQASGALAAAFEAGAKDVSLTEVMVNMQKSEVAFKAVVEVRNKFVDAYQEVMRMSM
ncbi:MAG: flagellar hook-basal body complex protein FliE [Zhongshania aliphaticivorans]|jgi:flagellar hook-basal body complex protein FliE|tara:strand:+ start:373 stop:714 length:342 start_codon:yes stop_codon:yes gene_type:complete